MRLHEPACYGCPFCRIERARPTDRFVTSTGKRIRLLGRLGPGGRNLAELPITVDAAGRHLLAYGYLGSSRMTVMNLTTGRRSSTTGAHLVIEGAHDRRLVNTGHSRPRRPVLAGVHATAS